MEDTTHDIETVAILQLRKWAWHSRSKEKVWG